MESSVVKRDIIIILANAPIANGNRGCVALSISMLLIIKKIFESSKINYKVYLTHTGFRGGIINKVYPMPKVDLQYISCMMMGGGFGFDYLKDLILRLMKKDARDSARIIKHADYILDIGQGDSFSDIYGKARFLYIDRIHRVARHFKIPYCLLPQTIGPFLDENNKKMADNSISEAKLCMARDKQSYDYVIHNVPNQKSIKEYIDVAFFLPFQKIELDSKSINVGLNISSLLWNGGYTGNNQFGLNIDYKKLTLSVINYFISIPNVKLHLVPHVVDQERGIENDYEVCYNLWLNYHSPNIVIAPFALGPIEIKSYIAGLDFFLGSRMHSTIAAFSTNVPSVPIAYSRKFNGLFKDTLKYSYMVDLKSDSFDEALAIIKKAFNNRIEIKDLISNRMNGIVETKKNLLLNDLRNFFNLK